MKKCRICGPYSRQNAQDFIEDIANTSNYTVEHCSVTEVGMSLFNVFIIYEDGVASVQKTKTVKGANK